jgi:hypothetical protein
VRIEATARPAIAPAKDGFTVMNYAPQATAPLARAAMTTTAPVTEPATTGATATLNSQVIADFDIERLGF